MTKQRKRGGPPRISNDQKRRIRELKKEQPSLSQAAIGKLVGLSAGAVNGVLNDDRPAAPVEPPAAPVMAPAEPRGEPDPEAERLESLKSLRGARELAEANRDPIRIIQAATAAAKVASQIERANPKPIELAKLPKTRELGARARKRLHDLLTRMQQQAEATS